jgi:hypothetical protein
VTLFLRVLTIAISGVRLDATSWQHWQPSPTRSLGRQMQHKENQSGSHSSSSNSECSLKHRFNPVCPVVDIPLSSNLTAFSNSIQSMGNLNRCGRIAPIHWTVLLSAKASTSTERALRANDSDLMQNSGKILSGGWIGSIHITPPGAIYRVCMSARPARPWPWIPPLRRILEQSMCVDHSPSITFAILIRSSLLYYTYSVYAR